MRKIKDWSYGTEKHIISEKSSFFLDVLRIVSAEFVLVAHFTDYHEDHYLRLIFKDAGVYSVGVFFILSGLLITNSVWNKKAVKKKYSFKDYFIDRFFRIYSALLPALVIGIIVDIIANQTQGLPLINNSIGVFAGNALMLQEYPIFTELSYYLPLEIGQMLRMPFMGSNLPLWTLSIEWWIYMFFGWILLRKKRVTWSYWLVFALFAVVPLFQLFIGTRMGPGLTLFWILGLVIAVLLRSKKEAVIKASNSKLLTLISVVLAMSSYGMGFWRIAIFATAIVIFQVLMRNSKGSVNRKLDRTIKISANYSFTLYLVHFPIVRLISGMETEFSVEFLLIINLLVCNVAALVIAYLFENRHKVFKAYWLNLRTR